MKVKENDNVVVYYMLTYKEVTIPLGEAVTSLFVRARPCFGYGVFRVPKNEIPKTNKPPAMRVVGIALAYSKKPPMVQ